MKYRRVVAKFGTSLLTAGSDRLNLEAMAQLVGQVVRLRAQGCEVVVVSSGAQAAGRHRLRGRLQAGHTPSRQAVASVGQSHLMQSWDELFDWHDTVVAQVLLTRRDLTDRLGYLNARNTLRDLIETLRRRPAARELMASRVSTVLEAYLIAGDVVRERGEQVLKSLQELAKVEPDTASGLRARELLDMQRHVGGNWGRSFSIKHVAGKVDLAAKVGDDY